MKYLDTNIIETNDAYIEFCTYGNNDQYFLSKIAYKDELETDFYELLKENSEMLTKSELTEEFTKQDAIDQIEKHFIIIDGNI